MNADVGNKGPRERDRFLVTIPLVDGLPVAEAGCSPSMPAVGDVIGVEAGRIWIVTSVTREADRLLVTVDLLDAPETGAARA